MFVIVENIWTLRGIPATVNGEEELLRKGVNEIQCKKGKTAVFKLLSPFSDNSELVVENCQSATLRASVHSFAKLGIAALNSVYVVFFALSGSNPLYYYFAPFVLAANYLIRRYSLRVERVS